MAPSPSSTAFILVPGAFCPGAHYEKVTRLLHDQGYEVSQIDLLTTGRQPNPPSMYEDAAHVRSTIVSFADRGKNVVLVGNSYGGTVITEAPKGVTLADRKREGKEGGVSHLIYIASLLGEIGQSTAQLVMAQLPPDLFNAIDGYAEPMDAATSGAMLAGGLPQEEQLHYAGMLKPMSTMAFDDALTYAAWKDVPTTFVCADQDNTLNPEWVIEHAREAVERAGENGKGRVKIVRLKANHVAMLTHPREVVEILLSDPPA
jgi:pimeloyl-ACP methyl ester carboxylesterase